MKTKEGRNSNIELLRILAMAFIVMGHFLGQTSFNHGLLTGNDFILTVLSSGSRIAVNIFLIIAVWFMVDSKFRAKRILLLYCQLYFYSAILTVIALFVTSPSIKDISRGFVPFFGRGLWFVSAYLTLYMIAPLLNKAFFLPVKQQRLLVVLLFVFVSLVSTLPDPQESYLCDSMWFWVVYLGVGYFKHNLYPGWKAKMIKSGQLLLLGGYYIFA